MGRLKAWQNLNPLFAGKYKKLLEEYGSKDYSKLLLQESLQDFISYNCGHCGHMQRLQAEDLNSIVSHAFRLAYAAHLQKSSSGTPSPSSSSSVKDVIPAPSSFSYNQHSTKPTSSHVTCCRTSASCCQPHCRDPQQRKRLEAPQPQGEPRVACVPFPSPSSGHNSSSSPSSRDTQRVEGDRPSELGSPAPSSSQSPAAMRTPPVTAGPASGALVSKPPCSLPGLHCRNNNHHNNSINNNNNNVNHNHCNNNFHSPDSDTSNSPTELNRTRRLGEKPPLIKNVNISFESNLRLEADLSSSTNPLDREGGHPPSIGGYVNDKRSSSERLISTDSGKDSSESKCRLHDDSNLKSLKATSGNLALDAISSSSDASNTPPPLPERYDSLTPPEEPHLKNAAWFQAGIPREIALEILSREPVGAFMVRESTSKPGCYALSLRVPHDFTVSGIAHYLIVKTMKGYKIKGFTKEFVTLTALITHHSVMPELLPCPLSLSRYNNPSYGSEGGDGNENDDDNERGSDEERDPDYDTLSDFRKMMADFKNA